MANTKQQMGAFFDDLKSSWYFRIWFVLWLTCFLAGFSALIILGKRSETAAAHESWRTWIQTETGIEYPSFCLRTSRDEVTNQLGEVSCNFNGLLIPTSNCDDGTIREKCVQLNMEGDIATKTTNNLQCTFGFNVSTDADKVIGFEIVKDREFGVAFTWIQPNANAWILLTKNIIEPKHGKSINMWGRQLLYHSSVFTTNQFALDIKMDAFLVFHFEENDYYTGWMAIGDIGGVGFFLVILHTIVMIVVGLFMENTSKFLNPAASGHEFQPIK